MYFGDHAYLRSTNRDLGISVELPAPDSAYLRLISGQCIRPKDGMLCFTVNTNWADEAPILYGYSQHLLAEHLKHANIRITGETTCSRWSWLT
jgi:hypothetical protein